MSQNQKPNDTDSAIGRNLAALRRERRVTQQDLGDALGVTFQQIQKYERGSNRLSAGRLLDAARYFRVPVAQFYEGVAASADLPAAISDPVLAEDSASLTGYFLRLPAEQRRAVLSLVDGLAARSTAA